MPDTRPSKAIAGYRQALAKYQSPADNASVLGALLVQYYKNQI